MTDAEKEAKKALENKESELAELKKALVTAEKRVSDAQEMINRQGNEIGEDRAALKDAVKAAQDAVKEMAESNKALIAAKEDLAHAQSELAELKKSKGPEGKGKDTPLPDEKTADEIEADLTEAEAKRLDEAFKGASGEMKAKIKSDDATRRKFLQKAKDVVSEDAKADLSSWRNTPAKKPKPSKDDGDELDKLFQTKKKGAEYVPPGPGGGVAGGPHKRREVNKPKPDWM